MTWALLAFFNRVLEHRSTPILGAHATEYLLIIYKFHSKHCFDRYEYDDHYFLTDPREFIYEFFPLQSEWQLLKNPITQRDFEDLPFVRSLFFRYGLYFPDSNTKAVMYTDATGKILFQWTAELINN